MWPRLMACLSRLPFAWARQRFDEDAQHELRAHIDLLRERYVRLGMTPDEAYAAARRQVGNATLVRQEIYDMNSIAWVDGLAQDVRYAFRQLRGSPGFTTVVVVTLALGIGANTALFSIINTALLRPLPYADPDRIVVLWERDTRRGLNQELVTAGSVADWRAQNTVFETLGYSPAWPGARTFLVAGAHGHERMAGAYVSSGILHVLGVQPIMGRVFSAEDDVEHSAPVALVSQRYWQRALSGRADVIGQPLLVDKYNLTAYTIVGVLPADFFFPGQSDIWLSAGQMGVGVPAPGSATRGGPWFEVVARLRPGVTVERAQAEMNVIASQLVQVYPGTPINADVTVRRLKDQLVGPARTALLVLFGAVAFVLMIACANVANLMLARGASRERELHIRAALGAGRQRLLRQSLVESLTLALIGGAVGVAFGYGCLAMTTMLGSSIIPRLHDVRIDGAVLLFTVSISVLAGLLFGMAPSVQLWTSDLNRTLKEAGRGGSAGAAPQRVKRALVIAEVALALVLLLGAALLMQSLVRLRNVEPGFRTDHALVVSLDLSSTAFAQQGAPGRRATMSDVLERTRRLQGVQSVGASSMIPLARGGWDDRPGAGWSNQPFTIEHQMADARTPPNADPRVVTPDFFSAMGVPLRAGRAFTAGDGPDAPHVLIVNETFARRYFPGYPQTSPLGHRLVFGLGASIQIAAKTKQPEWRGIVGVVADVRSAGLHAEPRPEMYLAYDQMPWEEVALVIHTAGDPEGLASAVRQEIGAISQNVTITRLQLLEDVVSESVAAPRFRTLLLANFSAAALLLAAIGIYGTIAYAVTQRTREIGIRMALGAQRATVLVQILREALVLTGIGVAIGLVGAGLLKNTISSLLFGITAMDPMNIVMVTVTLAAVAAVASLVPALRATRVDPLVALRAD
jgi:putative ABC transport system permease protein